MEMNMNSNVFKTNDFCLAAFLLTQNIEFLGIDRESSSRASFQFLETQNCMDLISGFSQMKAVVEPIAFHAAQKRLKQLLFLNR